MIRFSCSACRKPLEAEDRGAGRTVACPKCGQQLLVPPPIRKETAFSETDGGDLSEIPQKTRSLGRGSSRHDKPSKYPVARILITLQRVAAIVIAALWPIETIYIAVGTDSKPIEKIAVIFGLLVGHFLIILWILFLSELLQAFLDIAKNTQETAESIIALASRRREMAEEEQDD